MLSRPWIAVVVMAALAALAVALRLMVGGESPLALPESVVIWELRGQRAVAGLIVGAALAASGVLLQSLLRNPLASPDILGLSAGAALAVMAVTYAAGTGGAAGTESLAGAAWQAGPALLGAMAALGLVYAVSQRRGAIDPAGLVLVGVVVSIMCGAGVMLLQNLMPGRSVGNWRMLVGALPDDASWPSLAAVGLVTAAGIALAAWCGRAMDAAAMGDDEARSVGVAMGRLRLVMFLTAGVLTAGAVVLAGPVGFVGLIAPHLARLVGGGGSPSRPLVAAAALAGGALVVSADAGIKAVDLGAGRMPLGVVTALVGGVVFLGLLRKLRG